MLDVSEDFTEAEQSDVNKPAAKVYLILGNYATAAFGASASASGSASNYPAAGAINGDRTELNVGPASGADDDVGQSSWRSTVAPDSTPQTYKVDLGQSRTINRIKIYHLSSHAMKTFRVEWSTNDIDYNVIAKTNDQAGGTLVTTNEVDTIDFTDVTCRYLLLTINATVVAADMANLVEFEVYRLLDVTDRVISVKTSRSRDYQLGNSLAAAANIVLSNTDRFFSPSYTPTDDEVTDGFVNSELKPGLGILIKYGYDFTGSQEYAANFIGTIDKITIKPGARTATIDARDLMKSAFNKVVSTKLKSNTDLGSIVQYMLNKVNISTWESDVDQTGITIDYFFTFDQTVIQTIHDLVEGAGDANFFFDENGIATFRSYLNSTALVHIDTDEDDFEAGTLTDIDTTTVPGKMTMKWFKLENWSDGNYTSNPVWTPHLESGTTGNFSVVSEELVSPSGGTNRWRALSTPFSAATGTWQYSTKTTTGAASVFYFMINGTFNTTAGSGGHFTNSYSVVYNGSGSGNLTLNRYIGSTVSILASATATADTVYHDIRITRSSGGIISVYFDGVVKIVASDSTYSTSSLIAVAGFGNGIYFDNIYWSPVVEATEAVANQAIFVSQTIDQGSTISEESVFQTTQITPTGTSITWYTATSVDGSSWDAYVAATPGSQILSTARRYIRYKAVLDSSVYLVTPTITDVTVNWSIGTGSTKFPINTSFEFDESLNIDLDQIYADTVAGGSSIVNSVSVKAQPLVLDGSDSDVQWQGTTGTPPVDISAGNPLGVTNGQTLTYRIVVESGMDTSRMSGANPAAAAITFASGGAGSWVFSSIHPTRPILVITVSGTGTITNLQVQGKVFSSTDTFLEAVDSDTSSIEEFGERQSQISNQYIVNSTIAQSIATRLIDNLSEPTTYTPQVKIRPTFSVQIGDRVTLIDNILGINESSIVIGVDHIISANLNGGDTYTMLKLLKITS